MFCAQKIRLNTVPGNSMSPVPGNLSASAEVIVLR